MKLIFIIIFIVHLANSSYAVTAQDDRRIEEEKRKSLKSTEAQYYEEVEPVPIDEEEDTPRQYFNQLIKKKTARLEDVFYVMMLLLGKLDEFDAFEEQRDYFIKNDIVPPTDLDRVHKDMPVHRGYFAYMLFKALGLKGGLTLRILGPSERYAHHELVYEGIMVSGSSAEIMTGRELAYSFVQAADYIARYKN